MKRCHMSFQKQKLWSTKILSWFWFERSLSLGWLWFDVYICVGFNLVQRGKLRRLTMHVS